MTTISSLPGAGNGDESNGADDSGKDVDSKSESEEDDSEEDDVDINNDSDNESGAVDAMDGGGDDVKSIIGSELIPVNLQRVPSSKNTFPPQRLTEIKLKDQSTANQLNADVCFLFILSLFRYLLSE